VSDFYDDEAFDDGDDLAGFDAPTHDAPDTEQLLLRVREIIDAARPVPLSASSMIAKDEVLDLLDDALATLPDELRAARWLLKEKDEFLAKMRREGDEIIEQARTRAERMVQRTEVVKAAEQRAYDIVDKAETDARQLRHEVEDFCDQKLGSFEIVLERTLTMVSSGRAKLQGTNLTAGIPVDGADDDLAAADDFGQLPPPPGAAADEDWEDDGWDDEPTVA